MEELLQPYGIWCDGQCFGRFADLKHALIITRHMLEEGFESIVICDDEQDLFDTDHDFQINSWPDIIRARDLMLQRLFDQEAK